MIALFACTACGHTLFPARALCHRCGGAAWTAVACDRGVVEAVTIVQGAAVALACVRTPQGVRVIARLEQEVAPGATVALHEAATGALWARPASIREGPP